VTGYLQKMSELSVHRAEARLKLHDDFVRICKPVDASQLTFEGEGRGSMTEAAVADLWRRAPARTGGRSPRNHVYVHVPFCKSLCSFCNYERLRPSSPAVLRAWLDRVLTSLDTLGPAASHLRFHSLYFGGGTPSVLTAAMIREVVDAIHDTLDFHPLARRTFELDPAVMNAEKLGALKGLGFRYFSFGIQTLDAGVNADHNRGNQGREVIDKRFQEFASAGLSQVSCDFLLGMAGTTPEQVFAEIGEALRRWRPQWIDIYQLTPTEAYLRSHYKGDTAAFWAHLRPFQEQAPEALARAARAAGYHYEEGGGHRYKLRIKPTPRDLLRIGRRALSGVVDLSPYGYTQNISEQGRPLNLLGLGPSARSRIYGVSRFKARAPSDGGPMGYEGRAVDIRGESLSYLVFTLRDGDRLDRRAFRDIFGEDVATLHGEALAGWRRAGLIEALTAKHLVLKSQSRQERLRALLWLVPDVDLQAEIRKRGRR